MKRSSDDHGINKVSHRCIKGKADTVGIVLIFPVIVMHTAPGRISHQCTLRDHYSLGFSGRTGCIDHICTIINGCFVYRTRITYFGQDMANLLFIKHDACFRILLHICDTVGGITGIDGYVGGTCLLDAYDRGHEFLYPVHLNGHKTVFRNTVSYKPLSDRIRCMIKLSVCIGSVAVNNRSLIGMTFNLLKEDIYPCLFPVVFKVLSL